MLRAGNNLLIIVVIIVVIVIRDLHHIDHSVDENQHETDVTNC